MTLFNRQARTLFVTLFLCAVAALAQEKPKIALYIANDSLKQGDKNMLTRKFLSPFTASGLYNVIDRSDSFNEKVDKERQKQMGGSVNEKDIVRIGYEAGAKYVCIVELDYGLGRWNIGARMVDAETAEIYLAQGETDIVGELDKADFSGAAKAVFDQIHGKRSGGGSDGSVTQTQPSVSAQPQYTQGTSYQAQAPAYSGSSRATPKTRKFDYYFAPKYVYMPPNISIGANAEGGLVWGDGMFLGIDWGAGMDNPEEIVGYCLGGGFSFGKAYGLGGQLQLVYGGTAGFWWVRAEKLLSGEGLYDEVYQSINYLSFAGPFIKLRWNFVELAYKGLLGIKLTWGSHYKGESGMYGDLWKIDEKYGEKDSYISWNNHQLTLGLYFATSKRDR